MKTTFFSLACILAAAASAFAAALPADTSIVARGTADTDLAVPAWVLVFADSYEGDAAPTQKRSLEENMLLKKRVDLKRETIDKLKRVCRGLHFSCYFKAFHGRWGLRAFANG